MNHYKRRQEGLTIILQGRYAVGSSALLCVMPVMKRAKADEYGIMQPTLFILWFIDKTYGLVKGFAIEKTKLTLYPESNGLVVLRCFGQ